MRETRRLMDVVTRLRRECPWDRKQTHRTLMPYLIEEAYETIDAIESGKSEALKEELGDLLLQIALHAELRRERGEFSFEDVARGITDKMIRRHPHVFAKEAAAKTLKRHIRTWTALKSKEKPDRLLLEGIPRALPGLQLSQRYGEIAASVGFDWKNANEVLEKVREELGELEAELRKQPRRKARLELELGDLLFSLANLARHLGIDSDRAARKSAAKFRARFSRMEKKKRAEGKELSDCSVEELDQAWRKVKGSGQKGHRRGAVRC